MRKVGATEYTFENVSYVEMADFDEKQIQTFVTNWFRNNNKLADRCWEELSKKESEGLREMGRVPLLLGLLCLAYEQARSFAKTRIDIYEDAIEALLRQWDNKRDIDRDPIQIYKKLAPRRRRQLFNHVAAVYFEKGEFLIKRNQLAIAIENYLQKVPDIDVKEKIDGEVILYAIAAQHGIFVERAYQLFSFAHLSFQEYFVAKYVETNALKGSLEGLLTHINHNQWHEVFLLTTSLLDYNIADEFFNLFLQTINKLVAQDKNLQKLLVWANNKAEATNKVVGKYKKVALRFWYIYHTLARTLALALDLARALALDLDLDHILKNAIKKAENLNYQTIKERLLELLNNKPNPDEILSQLTEIRKDFRKLSGLDLLYNLNTTDEKVIKSLNWNDKFLNNLNNYLKANQLLLDCLEQAFVSNKESISNKLALPI